MSRAVTKGLPARPLTFAEMGTYEGDHAEILLTPFWAWLKRDSVDGDNEDLLVSVVCAGPGGIHFLGFDAADATWNEVITLGDDTEFTAVQRALDVIEQWLFERYPLDELVSIRTDPLDFLSSKSSLGA
jgi:hypothetical protein